MISNRFRTNFRISLAQILVIWISLILGGCQFPGRNSAQGLADKTDVFLLAGQSNMAGRGVVEAFDKLQWENLLSLGRDGEWHPAADPLHFDRPRAGVGPGNTFGRVVAEAFPNRRVALVPTACSGSPITVWRPGAYHALTRTYPYDDAMARARRAMMDGRLRAILWIQGESDSTAERAPLYYENLKVMIAGLRHDLGVRDVPMFIGRLPRFSATARSAWQGVVTEAQQRVAREVPHVHFVDMPILTSLPDGIHADAASAREMGRRLAEAYLRLYGKE